MAGGGGGTEVRADTTDRLLISGRSETDPAHADLAVIREERAKQGWIEGRNLQIDRRFGSGDPQ